MAVHETIETVKGRAGEFAEGARGVAGEVAGSALQKSKQFLEITKLNLANAAEESAIKKLYATIGKAYYEAEGKKPDAIYAELCGKIDVSRATIEENRSRIAELRLKPEAEVEVEIVPEEPAEEAKTEE